MDNTSEGGLAILNKQKMNNEKRQYINVTHTYRWIHCKTHRDTAHRKATEIKRRMVTRMKYRRKEIMANLWGVINSKKLTDLNNQFPETTLNAKINKTQKKNGCNVKTFDINISWIFKGAKNQIKETEKTKTSLKWKWNNEAFSGANNFEWKIKL